MMPKGDPFETLFSLDAYSASRSTDACAHHFAATYPDGSHPESHPPSRAIMLPQGHGQAKPKPVDGDVLDKRKRHADAERERIHRKQTGILRMRDEVEQLERQLHSLSTTSAAGTAPSDAVNVALRNKPSHTQLGDDTTPQPRTAVQTSDLYVRALTESGLLRREKASLQAKLKNAGLVEVTVESLLNDLIDETTHQPTPPDPRDAVNKAMRQISYRDVLSTECYDLMCDLVSQSNRFAIHASASSHPDSPTTALNWSVECRHDDNDVRFSLTKSFPTADLEELASSVWLAFHDLDVVQTIVSPSIRVEVLQRISDDVLIVQWQIDCPDLAPNVRHCRNLIFRWTTPHGCYVGCRTIDETEPMDPPVASINPTSRAFEQFYWAKFTQEPSGHGCEVTFAGRVSVGNGAAAFARFLCAEIPISILRWENMVVGPLFNFETSAIV